MEFTGHCAQLLEQFAELMERLWQEHRTSPTLAGKEEFYSWGNIDYIVVMSARKFDDLVEVITKDGRLDIKKNADGKIDCQPNLDYKELHRKETVKKSAPLEPPEIMKRTIAALKHYYYSSKR